MVPLVSSATSVLALDLNARVVTLEVRLSNRAARALYGSFGFRPVGIRPRYYSDNGEDALIMTTEALDSPGMLDRVAALRAALDQRPIDPDEGPIEPPDGEAYRG